jgi:class 3 adenylate cyclase
MRGVGGVFMCAAGLFDLEVDPPEHAEQSVRFAIECIRSLEESNAVLGSRLVVRVGINTGGPITAGVLGTTRPTFDILGDAINIAAWLQSSCIAGKVQIGENTFHLVKSAGFMIEPRGEIFLKGKGMRPTFLVSVPMAGVPSVEGSIVDMARSMSVSPEAVLPPRRAVPTD